MIIVFFFVSSVHSIDVNKVWLQQNGALYRTYHAPIDLLRQSFDGYKRCAMLPLDNFQCVAVKENCYAEKQKPIEHLTADIHDANA